MGYILVMSFFYQKWFYAYILNSVLFANKSAPNSVQCTRKLHNVENGGGGKSMVIQIVQPLIYSACLHILVCDVANGEYAILNRQLNF